MSEKKGFKALFAANLTRLRKEAGLSQSRLAEISGITHNFINDLENMKKSASPKTMDMIAAVLDADPVQFFIDPSHWDAAEKVHFLATLDSIHTNINRVFERYRGERP
jgi:transcriptional regulator with XRE-family HTH domain